MTNTYIDINELTARIAESCLGMKRPKDVTAGEALRQLGPEAAGFSRAALAAARYIAECCNANHPGSIEVIEMPPSRAGE